MASDPEKPKRKFVSPNDLKTVINHVNPQTGAVEVRPTMRAAAVMPRNPPSGAVPPPIGPGTMLPHPPAAASPAGLFSGAATSGYGPPGVQVQGQAHSYAQSYAQNAPLGATMAMQVADPLGMAVARSPIAKTLDPPEISLTRHQMPEDTTHDSRLVLTLEPDSARAASFRVLRHHLLENGRPQVIVVSSPGVGEGKTTTAVNLALALAECGRSRVLLCEANVARPQLATVFRFVPPWCFAEQLTAHREQPLLPWGLVEIPEMWLHVAAINPRSTQSQLLDAPAFEIAMERLRLAEYDHIVIDAPSVLGSADVNLIQDASDGVLLSMFSKRMKARDLRRAVEQLTPTRILGTVLLES